MFLWFKERCGSFVESLDITDVHCVSLRLQRDNKQVKFRGVSYSVSEPHRVSNAAAFADLLNGPEGIIMPRLQKLACLFFGFFFILFILLGA